MTKGRKLSIAGGAVALLVVGVLLFRGETRRERAERDEDAAEARARRWRGWAAGIPGIAGADSLGTPGAPGAVATPAEVAKAAEQVTAIMNSWRTAIVVKDAPTVLSLDAAFTGTPTRYMAALVTSAGTDSEDRVRAFSTRVLGKLHAPILAEVFADLLEDKSPYVRQNAAWGLGELGSRPDGREAAQRATSELRRLEQQDAAKDVRVAANTALRRLE